MSVAAGINPGYRSFEGLSGSFLASIIMAVAINIAL
jgi:hypothetical protein